MSDYKDMPLEAEFHTLRHVLPPGISGVDDQLLKVHLHVLFGNKGYNLENFRIIRARTTITDRGPKGEEEKKEAYYASLITLSTETENGFIVLLTGPTYVAATQPAQSKKAGSWIGSSRRYADYPDAAKRNAVIGLIEMFEEKIHESILVAEKEPRWMGDVRAAGQKTASLISGSASGSAIGR